MAAFSNRAGSYIQQVEGYKAFEPKPLPPDPPLKTDPELNALLADATLAIGRLDGAIRILPNPDLFVFMYVRKEAVLSSQIEGTQSSLTDVLEAEAEILNAERPRDVPEVINYVRAMNHGLERLDTLPVSVRLIREIHEVLLTGVRGHEKQPGEIRTTQNWIGPLGCTLTDAAFVPPPPSEVVNALGDLERYLHGESDHHDLIRIGLAHAQFETIHPFLDGNGRVGRLLITLLLCERKILHKPLLYISNYFRRHRDAYYNHLQAVRDEGDWEGWLKFFLKGVAEVSLEAAETAQKIVAMRESHRQIIQENFAGRGNNAAKILDYLFKRPIIQVVEVESLLNVSFPAANRVVAEMVQHGMLKETTGQKRHRRFEYKPYIDLFADRRAL